MRVGSYELDDSIWYAGATRELNESEHAEWGFGWNLDHNCTPDGECGPDLATDHPDWEVPRAQSGDDTNRLRV